MLISVVIPFFHRVESLQKALSSIGTECHSLEIVISVDSSSPFTPRSLGKRLRESDFEATFEFMPSVKITKSRFVSGPGGTRNWGISKTSGEILFFLDDDDIFLPGKIDTQVSFMERADAAFCFTDYIRFQNDELRKMRSTVKGWGPNYAARLARFDCTIATPTVAVRRGAFLIKMFPENLRNFEDQVAWYRLAKRGLRPVRLPITLTLVDASTTSLSRPADSAEQRSRPPSELEEVKLPASLILAYATHSLFRKLSRLRPR